MKDPTLLSVDPDLCFHVIEKCQDMLNKLTCTTRYEGLNFVGKMLIGGEFYVIPPF